MELKMVVQWSLHARPETAGRNVVLGLRSHLMVLMLWF